MANYRIPGPIGCHPMPWPIEDGTLIRALASSPGSVCAESPLYPVLDLRCLFVPATEPDLEFLFNQCRNPTLGVAESDYEKAVASLGVEVAAIKAVAEVETSGAAFDDSGRPRILYERHYFHRLTGGKYSAAHADISSPDAGGYGKFSAQYGKLERAFRLDRDAALRSASWGRFQIMGNNFVAAGFVSVSEFVLAMTRSESEHLAAFVNFVGSNSALLAALRKKNWSAFAAGYNGPGYKKNDYDTKMEAAYKRFAPKAPAVPDKRKP